MANNMLNEPLLKNSDIKSTSTGKSRMDQLMSDYRDFDPTASYEFRGHTGACWACAMTSDNSTLFSGSDDKLIKVWDCKTTQFKYDLIGQDDCIYCLELTKDDKLLLSGGWDNRILIWDWRNKTIEAILGSHTNQVFAMWLTSDGKNLVTGGRDSYARIWDLEERKQIGEMHCGGDSVFGLTVTHDKKEILTADGTQNIRIFNFESCQPLSVHLTNNGVPQCITVTTDKKYIIIGTRTFCVLVWNFSDKSVYFNFKTHLHWVRGVSISSDNNFIFSASADKTIRIYNIANKSEEGKLNSDGFINAEYLSKDGTYLLASSTDKLMRMWKIGIPLRVKSSTGHTNTIICLAITSDNNFIVTGSEDKTIRIWSIKEFCQVAELTGHTETIWAITVTHNMRTIASGSADQKVNLWDFETKTLKASMLGHKGTIYAISASSDNKYLVTASNDMKLILWDVGQESLIKVLDGHTDTVFTVKFTADCKFIVSGAADYTVRVWNMNNLGESEKIDTGSGMIESLSLNENETFLVIGDRNNLVHLWDWKNRKLIKRFNLHTNWIKAVHFAPDGNTFLSCASDYNIRVWNASEERHDFLLKGHTNFVRTAAFTMDGKYIISAGNDITIKLWDVQNIGRNELVDIGSTVDTFVYLAKIKNKTSPEKNLLNAIYSPLKINLAHFYAYLGYDELLKKTLMLGTDIRIDEDGHSPLFYALYRRCQSCIDVILNFIIELKSTDFEKFKNFSYALRGDFELLLDNRSEFLPDFLNAIFYKVPDVTNFAVPKINLPYLQYSKNNYIDVDDFVYKISEIKDGETESPIQFNMLPFAISYIKGSSGSLDILDSISHCTNQKILETEFVKTYIKNKWDDLWNYIFILTLLIWANLLFMIILIILCHDNLVSEYYYIPCTIIFLIINVLLTIYEIVQAYSQGGYMYFSEIWNIIDVLRAALCFTWTPLTFIDTNADYFKYMTWMMVLVNFLRGLSGFRAFDNTRYYTRLVIRAFFETLPFLIIFFYITLAFGVISFISAPNSTTTDLSYFWRWPYELSVSGFTAEGTDFLEYLCFIFGTIINVIIILNLLISILGDSFDSFQAESQQIDCLDMTELVIELEILMFWNRNIVSAKYFQHCKEIDEHGRKWEGKLKAVIDVVNKAAKESKENYNSLTQQNQKILKLLELYKPKLA